MQILGLSGSLRRASSNTQLLEAAALLAPPPSAVLVYDGIENLPHFNPDVEAAGVPDVVHAFRAVVEGADAVLVCCPEYAGGIPGAFKNALDWLVGCMAMYEKPVAILSASPASQHVPEALRRVLGFLSARIVPAASITLSLRGAKIAAAEIASTQAFADPLRAALEALMRDARSRASR